jgi:hypothetical protein
MFQIYVDHLDSLFPRVYRRTGLSELGQSFFLLLKRACGEVEKVDGRCDSKVEAQEHQN